MPAASKTPVLAFAPPQPLGYVEGQAFTPPDEIVWMPAGETVISAGGGTDGQGFMGPVLCDERAAASIQASFLEIKGSGARVYLDFNHDDAEASADVRGFTFDPARGIVASVEWTKCGVEALEAKTYYSFSPAFLIDRESKRPVSLIPGHAAGGLVNAPAFGARMPALIAARLAGPAPLSAAVAAEAQTTVTIHMSASATAATAASDSGAAPVKAADSVSLDKVVEMIEHLASKVEAMSAPKEGEKKEEVAAKAKPVPPAPSAPVAPEVIEAKRASIEVKPSLTDTVKAYASKRHDPRAKAAVFARDFAPRLGRDFTGRDVAQVLAANSLGTLAGDLIAQRALALLKYKFPILTKITTDFSDMNGQFNQTIRTRTRAIPTATDFVAGTGYGDVDYTATDVPVTINKNKAVQTAFNVNEIASTARDLFGESQEGAINGLLKAMVDDLYALIIAANYSNATTITPVAATGLTRSDLVDVGVALNKRYVSTENRSVILNSDAFGALFKDSTILNLATYQRPAVIEEQRLPNISGFDVIEQPFFPTANKLIGFGFTPDALVAASRLSNDYTAALPGASYGNVTSVIDPDTGLSLGLQQWVDHNKAEARQRFTIMYGVAKGQVASGQRILTT